MSAADYQLGPDDIIGFENGDEGSAGYNYDQWHIGSVYNPDLGVDASLEFTECSVMALPVPDDSGSGALVTQLLKGFPIDERPTAEPFDGIDEIRDLVDSISIDVAAGSLTLQIPMFVYFPDSPAPSGFTTYRSATDLGPGVHTLDGVQLANSTGGAFWGDGNIDIEVLLDDLEEAVDEDGVRLEVLGVGFAGWPGAEVNSISFGGDTYYFGTGDCLPEQDDEDDEDDSDDPTAPRPPERVDTGR